MIAILGGLLAVGGVLVVAKSMCALSGLDEHWTEDDEGAYEVLCNWERES